VATHYINWADVRDQLDPETVGHLDIPRAQGAAEEAEARFDNRLRRHFTLPFTAAGDAEAYALAKKICAKWAAAIYLRQDHSAEGTAEDTWYADWLDKDAESFVALLETRRSPPDAEAAADPLQYVPSDGVTDPTERSAIFSRANITTGSGHW